MLDPAHLRGVARTFKRQTAQTYDGFHPRQLGDLSDSALETLATILQAVEITGSWPRQLRLVMTAAAETKGWFPSNRNPPRGLPSVGQGPTGKGRRLGGRPSPQLFILSTRERANRYSLEARRASRGRHGSGRSGRHCRG